VRARPWASIGRVEHAGGVAWLKACGPVQAFEPRLAAGLSERWPDLVLDVLAADPDRGWLLAADAGIPIGEAGDLSGRWLDVLPRYAELQRGEAARAEAHLAAGVPDLRLGSLAAAFDAFVTGDLLIPPDEAAAFRALAPLVAARADELAAALAAAGIPETVQHGDLHPRSVYVDEAGRHRILDWGDASIGQPFATLLVTFQWLREGGLAAGDPTFTRLRDAYLEPWGSGLVPVFELAQRVAAISHALTWLRHLRAMGPGAFPTMDALLPDVLGRAAAAIARA
jgi:hypothetical protein